MIPPVLPEDERQRLEALRNLSILDTPPEERFDRLTRLAKQLFDVPIAIVSLVDSDRQWFKSIQGLDASETSREVSFCGHAILQSKLFIVEDAAGDPRFADNPLVTGAPDIRFYAGCPLTDANGYALGTLCLIDTEPRSLSEELGARTQAELTARIASETVDRVTGLSNLEGFLGLGSRALYTRASQGLDVDLVIFELSDYRAREAALGPAEAGALLRRLLQGLMDLFSDADLLSHLGGGRFAATWLAGDDGELLDDLRARLVLMSSLNPSTPLEFRCRLLPWRHDSGWSMEELLERGEALLTAARSAA